MSCIRNIRFAANGLNASTQLLCQYLKIRGKRARELAAQEETLEFDPVE